MNDEEIKEEIPELPWLIFTLGGKAYAVNSRYVNDIEMVSDDMTPIPRAPEIYRGMVERRGEVYPLIDMRSVFGFRTINQEVSAFVEMMEQRKQDHINWLEALTESVNTGKPFALATDPHNCAFGKWYYSFMQDNRSAALHINKVEEPHRLLHEAAPVILDAAKKGDTQTVESLLKKAREVYVPKVLAVLDEAEHAFRSTLRETVVVISGESHFMGMLVDEVLDIGKLTFISGNEKTSLLSQSKYFAGVARNDRVKLEILVINEAELLKLAEVPREQ